MPNTSLTDAPLPNTSPTNRPGPKGKRPRKPLSRTRLVAVVVAMALVAVGCGSDSTSADSAAATDDGVASIGASDSEDEDSASNRDSESNSDVDRDDDGAAAELEAPEDPEDAYRLFDECMSEAGIDFGDAVAIGGSGDEGAVVSVDPADAAVVEVDPQSGSLEDFGFEDFEEANATCGGHLANVDPFLNMSAEEKAAFEDAELKWRQCMEDLGVEVPEFDGGGGVVVQEVDQVEVDPQTGQPSFEDTEFEQFNEAATECQSHFDDVAGGGS